MIVSFGSLISNCSIYFDSNIMFARNAGLAPSWNNTISFRDCYNFNGPVSIPDHLDYNGLSMFENCYKFNQPLNITNNVTDCSCMFNKAVSLNAPVIFGNNVENCAFTFSKCTEFNQPVNITGNVTDCKQMFQYDFKLNSPIIIGDNVTNCSDMFNRCCNLNSPISIGNSVSNCVNMFKRCSEFNQPVTIPNSVVNCHYMFYHCFEFNQPLVIPNGVTNCAGMLSYCFLYDQDIYIPDSVGLNFTGLLSGACSFNHAISVPTLGTLTPPFSLFDSIGGPNVDAIKYNEFYYYGDNNAEYYFNGHVCGYFVYNSHERLLELPLRNGIKVIARDTGEVAELVANYKYNTYGGVTYTYICHNWLYKGNEYPWLNFQIDPPSAATILRPLAPNSNN